MTQGGIEEEPTLRRSLRWKKRLSRPTRQQDQQDQPQQYLQPPELTVNGSTSDVASDDNSILSNEPQPGDEPLDDSAMTKSQQTRNKDLHCHFKQVPSNDKLLRDFNCALQKDVLLQGRLFITQSFVCFKSNILGYVTTVEFKIESIKHIDRVRTLRWMPRVLQITTKNDDKYTFTSFLSSLSSSRDEAYYCLIDLWQQNYPQATEPSSILSSSSSSIASESSTTTAISPLPSTTIAVKVSLPAGIPDNDMYINECNDDPVTPTTQSINKGIPASNTPTSGHFKIFHRRRAQTVSAPNDSPSRERSATSSSTPLARNTNGHITWIDDGQENTQPIESRPISPPPPSTLSPGSSILKTRKNLVSSPPTIPSSQHDNHPLTMMTRINIKTLLTVGGILLFLSHVFLTYEFYHVTQLFNQQQQQQQQHTTITMTPFQQQQHDTAWISGQLKDVKNQAQLWEMETLRQRRQLLDLIPS